MRRLALALLALALLRADMFPDASNAALPAALHNFGLQTPAACDGFAATDGVMSGGALKQFSSASASFTSADIGKPLSVRGAGVKYFAAAVTVSAGGAGHTVGDLVGFPDGVQAFVTAVTAGAVTGVYLVAVGSSATNPATLAQTASVKSGSTIASPVAGGTGLVLTTAWVRENHVSTIASVSNATTVMLTDSAGQALSGAVWGYGTDYGVQIQAALDAGQQVSLPAGVCGHAQTLVPGGGRLLGKGILTTSLMYLGAPGSPQIRVGNQAGSRVSASQVGNFFLDGLGAASKGLYLRGASSGLYWDMLLKGHTTVGLDVHGNDSGIDSIKNWFQRLDIPQDDGPYSGSKAHGVWWGFPNTYDIGSDHDLSHYMFIQTKTSATSPGLVCGVTDHNSVGYIQTRGGTELATPGVDLLGGNWAALGHCRNNIFHGMDAGAGGLLVRGTGWLHAPNNIVDFYDRGNGGPIHRVETGGSVAIRDSNQKWDGLRFYPRGYTSLDAAALEGTAHYAINIGSRNPGALLSAGLYRAPVMFDGTNWRVAYPLRERASLNAAHASPTGTTSTTHVMMGLGSAATIAPAVSGNVSVTIWGTVANSAAAGNTRVRLLYGTGAAPANGGAYTGTGACTNTPQVSYTSSTAGALAPFSMTCLVMGLTLDTTYWFDAAVAGSAANTSTISGVTIQAAEQ